MRGWKEEAERQSRLSNALLLPLQQGIKITEKEIQNAYTVNRQLVNSKAYYDKFKDLPLGKLVRDKIYQYCKEILEHRDGTPYEDMYVIDARTGNLIVKSSAKTSYQTGLNDEEYEKVKKFDGPIVIIHNHPAGRRPSFQDILTAFKTEKVAASVVAGHNGELHWIYDFDRSLPIEHLYDTVYNKNKDITNDKRFADLIATDTVYKEGGIKHEKR